HRRNGHSFPVQLFDVVIYFFKQKTAYEIGLGIPAETALPICDDIRNILCGMALLILALLQRIFLMSSLMLLLVWLIFFMVLIKRSEERRVGNELEWRCAVADCIESGKLCD